MGSARLAEKNFPAVRGSDHHRSRFRSTDRIHDNEISVRPNLSARRTGIQDPHATTTDAVEPSLKRLRKRSARPLPLWSLAAPARAAAVVALVARAVANHDRSAVGAGRRVLLALKRDLHRARFRRQWPARCRGL